MLLQFSSTLKVFVKFSGWGCLKHPVTCSGVSVTRSKIFSFLILKTLRGRMLTSAMFKCKIGNY